MVCDWAPQHRNVRLYRDLDDAALATLFAQSWAFLCTSSYEGFGIPYIEALASGTAIVAARNPGAVEVLRDGRFGVICEDGELGARTCEVLEDATLRGALEHNGLERAREFSVQRIAANYLALYRELA
jgi:glycosyltransferase involved in cell wall biosynthesis